MIIIEYSFFCFLKNFFVLLVDSKFLWFSRELVKIYTFALRQVTPVPGLQVYDGEKRREKEP